MPITRLKNVIKEFNISLQRAVEFLSQNNIEIAPDPNVKIESHIYEIFSKEFEKDKVTREEVERKIYDSHHEKSQNFIEEKSWTNEPVGKNKIHNTQSTESTVIVQQISNTLNQNIEENNLALEGREKNIYESLFSEKTLLEKTKFSSLKVIGKIDLAQNRKVLTKKEDKKEKNIQTNSSLNSRVTPKIEVRNIIQNKEKLIEIKNEALLNLQEESGEKIEVYETQYQKLDGPKIIGQKIDLAKFEKIKKEEKENQARKKDRKKRKRIQEIKVDLSKTVVQPENKINLIPKKSSDKLSLKKNIGINRFHNQPRPYFRNQNEQIELSEEEIQNKIKETYEKLTNKKGKSKSSKYRKEKRTLRRENELLEELNESSRAINVTEFITVNELASLMNISPTEIITSCFSLGVMVTMNQRLEADTLTLVAAEFGHVVNFVDTEIEEALSEEYEDSDENLVARAPIVTVMGHVDHGKTSLLDCIRKANVIAGESGGITQHIGAYNVELQSGEHITFLDTPGHEAFTAMRARGVQITDIVIIVIAADDEVMPQTKEAISHAQAARVPIIIALNKVDKPTANPDRIREQLSAMNILVEEWGGKYQCQEISAKFGNNVDILLEKVLLEAEVLDLKANPNKNSSGVVIEASLDKGRGYVTTVIVQTGTLKIGDYLLAGKNHGKVRTLLDERGYSIKKAKPSQAATIIGLDGAPTAGDKFKVFDDEREAKQIANKREQLQREQSIRSTKHTSLEEIGRRIALGNFKELKIILKGDVDGSVEALTDSLQKISTEEIQINIIHKGVGQITESDVLLASASDAIIIGFNVRPSINARDLAEKEEIDIRYYSIIYDAIEEVKEAMEGMLSPEIKEQIIGNVEIREVFKISKVGSIAGCVVTFGKVTRHSNIRVLRKGIVIHEGTLESLKRFKDDVKEVLKGYECGLNIKGFNNIEVSDQLEVYEKIEVKKKLR